jgi:hypothetical protein
MILPTFSRKKAGQEICYCPDPLRFLMASVRLRQLDRFAGSAADHRINIVSVTAPAPLFMNICGIDETIQELSEPTGRGDNSTLRLERQVINLRSHWENRCLIKIANPKFWRKTGIGN